MVFAVKIQIGTYDLPTVLTSFWSIITLKVLLWK